MRIALFVIATGNYIQFVTPLIDSVRKYFLTDHKVDIFVFTDSDVVPEGTTRVYVQHRPFPYPTLMRYNFIHDNRRFYEGYDCYFYCDADMLFVGEVGDEVLGELVSVQHPGFYNKKPVDYPNETSEISTAYIKKGDNEMYFAGGFNGGRKYLEMANIIRYMVEIDQYKDHVPVWHDESYLNRYLLSYPPDVVLDPTYCWPEFEEHQRKWGLTGTPKLVALDKFNMKKPKFR
jgi:histo-blood group ABO system transferase